MDAAGERELGGDSAASTSQKSPDAFRTISEVSTDLDVPQHVLRFWEGKFAQIRPMKRGGGRRYYRPEDVDLLRGIQHLLYGDGYTIKGVQKLLRENGVKFVVAAGRREQPEKAKRTPATVPTSSLSDVSSQAEPGGRLGGAPDFAPAHETICAAPESSSVTAVTTAPNVQEPRTVVETLFDFAAEQETTVLEGNEIDTRRLESAARLLARLKTLRRDYVIRLQAAKTGR